MEGIGVVEIIAILGLLGSLSAAIAVIIWRMALDFTPLGAHG